MSKKVCPQCSCTDVSQDWYAHDQGICFVCNTCGFVGDTEEFKEPTLFDRITASPEVLAEWSVYAHENCRIPDGATSPFIDNIFWFDDEKGDTWDERFDSAWEKAIAATVAKLKEVAE